MQDLIVSEDASAIKLAALGQGKFHALAWIAKSRDSRAEKNGVDVQANFVNEAGDEERLGEFAAAHQADLLSGAAFQIADEVGRVGGHKHNARIVNGFERA